MTEGDILCVFFGGHVLYCYERLILVCTNILASEFSQENGFEKGGFSASFRSILLDFRGSCV